MATELTEYGKLLQSFQEREKQARLSNLSRKKQIENIYGGIIKRYEPGGAFGAGYESLLQRQKVRDVGATAQRDISRGLYGIRPYEAEWEATTGATGRLRLEDIRMERLGQAQTGMAGFLERIEEPYPDYGLLMQASAAMGQGGGAGGGYVEPISTTPRQSMSEALAAAHASNPYMRPLLGGQGGGVPAPLGGSSVRTVPEAQAIRAQRSSGGMSAKERLEKSLAAQEVRGRIARSHGVLGKYSPTGTTTGDTSQEAFTAAKAAGRPWTYNYATWLSAKRSGKTS